MTPQEHEALLRTRALLAAPDTVHGAADAAPRAPHEFSMQITYHKSECGTCACIGGWMGVFMGLSEPDIDAFVRSPEFTSLFFPDLPDFDAITPSLAVEAIDNLLAGMDAEEVWKAAWAGSPEAAKYIAETETPIEIWSPEYEENPR